MPKDGMPKVTPSLATLSEGELIIPRTEVPKVWVFNYQIRLQSITTTRSLMVPRGSSRDSIRQDVAQAMALDLAHVLEEQFGD